jgi:hypothetical protein
MIRELPTASAVGDNEAAPVTLLIGDPRTIEPKIFTSAAA